MGPSLWTAEQILSAYDPVSGDLKDSFWESLQAPRSFSTLDFLQLQDA